VSRVLIADDHASFAPDSSSFWRRIPPSRRGERPAQRDARSAAPTDWTVLLDIHSRIAALGLLRHIQPAIRTCGVGDEGLPEQQYAVNVLRAGAAATVEGQRAGGTHEGVRTVLSDGAT